MMTIQVLAFAAACVFLQVFFPQSCHAQTCPPTCGPNSMCVNGTDGCICKTDFYLDGTDCSACNCVTGATCDQSGVCTCSLVVCDKDLLTVSLTSSASDTIIDTSTVQESVTLTCTINLPPTDVTVKIKDPNNNELTLTGVYSVVLSDVHPANSGTYQCEVTTMIDGRELAKDSEITLTVVLLSVSLTSSASDTIIDTSTVQESVTLTCTINLPAADVTVQIKDPNNNELTLTESNGVYSKILSDVHPANSGTYRCEVTTMIDGRELAKDSEITLTVVCDNDFHGSLCDMRCNCITGSDCNPDSGSCDCTTPPFIGAVCDKGLLDVSLMSSASGKIIDTSTVQEPVTLTCTINLPATEVTVKIKNPNGDEFTLTESNGVYSVVLSDVHPDDSGTYRCEVTTMIDESDSTKHAETTLTVACDNDFHGSLCDMRCNCITASNCNPDSGSCDCTTPPFIGAVCDKDNLDVSMSSSRVSPVTDVAGSPDQVSLTCNVNLPSSDVTVKITKLLSETALPLTPSSGMYTVILNNVHPADSGTYRCEVTTTIDGSDSTTAANIALTVECSADFSGANCDMKCNCVTDSTCNQDTSVCDCEPAFSNAVCDKDGLRVVSVISIPPSTVSDTSSIDDVIIQCHVNLPNQDIQGVGLIKPGGSGPLAMTFTSYGTYNFTLPDVHSLDSGQYTCQATAKGLDMVAHGSYQLQVNDVNECLNNAPNTHNCDPHAKCTNEDGGFVCECLIGYEGDGYIGGSNTGCAECMDSYGFNCSVACTCVSPVDSGNDVVCNNVNGMCTCTEEFLGKECNKANIRVTLSSDPVEILDTSGVDNVTLKCTVNLHSRDLSLPVTVAYPNGSTYDAVMNTEGLYEVLIIDVTSSNNGQYTCNATTTGGTASASTSIDLNVVVKGGIVSVSEPMEVRLGETVQIYCKVYAQNDSTITWYFGASSDPIMSNAKYSISEEDIDDLERTSFLNISNIVRSDNGAYQCKLENTNSTSFTLNATVIVIERPEIANVDLVTLSHDMLNVSWDLTFDGNLPLQDCSVGHQESGSSGYNTNNTNSDILFYPVMELKPYTQYDIQVQCRNEVGMSDVINGGPQQTFQSNPSEPTNVQSMNVRPNSFTITWSEPIPPNGPIEFYRVQISSIDDMEFQEKNTTSQMQPFDNLFPYTEYTVIVTAFNRQFDKDLEGTPSDMMTIRSAQDVPSPPLNVLSINDKDFCVISWDKPKDENGIIQSYTVHYTAFPRVESGKATSSDGSESEDVNGNVQKYPLAKGSLAAYSDFEIRVSAKTEAQGSGEKSEVANGTCITISAAPPAPAVPTALRNQEQLITSSSFMMNITPANPRNGPISCYEIIVKAVLEGEDVSSMNPNNFSNDDIMSYQNVAENPGVPYRAIAIDGSEVSMPKTLTIGDNTVTNCGSSSRRKREAKKGHIGHNGNLVGDTKYTAFVRAFVKVGDGETHTSSPFMEPVTTAPAASAVPVVVGVILAILIIVVIVLVVLIYHKQRRDMPLLQRENGFAMDPVMRQQEKESEVTHMVVLPIAIEELPEKVQQKSQNEDEVFKNEFKSIPEATGSVTRDASQLECNKEKNRYINITAYDRTRVKLMEIKGVEGSDYINACYVDGYGKPKKFIAAQGPREDTVIDFWRMIWEQNCSTVIMLTKCLENGREKCAEYWPEEDAIMYDDIIVTLDDVVTCADYVIRKFTMQKSIEGEDEDDEPVLGESRILMQFHFLGWPDFGVPKYPHSLLCFIKRIRHMSGNRTDPGNTVIHCSAGVGRTGTYILIDSMLDMMKKEKKVDIYNVIYSLRNQRNLLVQSLVQYILIHKALAEEYLFGHTEVDVGSLHILFQKLSKKDPDSDFTGLDQEYRTLASLPVENKDQKGGNIEANKHKNRLRQVIPYDFNRVKLERLTGQEHSNYINASFIDGYEHKKAYIAAQGPLPNTMGDFWRLAWENQCSTIVMMSECEEKGQPICCKYWPEKGDTVNHAFLTVTVKDEKEKEDFTIRDLEVSTTKGGGTKLIRQYHFHGWPEVGSPETAASLIKVMGLVYDYQHDIGRFPILVHCSAGSGRTGVFVALSFLLQRAKAEGIVDIFQTVRSLRQQRPHMVQDLEQYQFCYRAMLEYLDSFDHYANFK